MARITGNDRNVRFFGLILCLTLVTGCRKPQTWTVQARSVPPPPVLGSGQDDTQDFNVVWTRLVQTNHRRIQSGDRKPA